MNSMYSTDNNNKLQPQNEQEQRMYENVDKFLNSVDEHFPFIQLYNNNYNIHINAMSFTDYFQILHHT